MYSLDQVIYFLEQRQQTEDWNIRDAAIAYLKGYREVLPEYAQMKLDAVKNEPLTWNELEQMDGKPVWVEYDNHLSGRKRIKYKVWDVIDWITEDLILVKGDYSYQKDEFGDVWQAYRKERS